MTPPPSTTERVPARLVAFDASAFRRWLIETEEMTDQDVRVAQEVARRNGVSEFRAMLDLGLIAETSLADLLARWSDAARWNTANESSEVCASIPARFMRNNAVIGFRAARREPIEGANAASGAGVTLDAGPIRLVVADPSDRHAWNAVLSRFSDRLVSIEVGTQKEIGAYLEVHAEERSEESDSDCQSLDISGELTALRDMASEAPVVRFLNQCVERAMELGASDIHIERFDRRVSLRFRIDGMLVDQPSPPANMYDPILCRIKILANLDIAERRLAQDGRIRMRLRGRQADMRVSIVPTMYGQDAAIRLQDRQKLADIDLLSLGFAQHHIDRMMRVASKSHGILLITGPTGSGKTTTLYAILHRLVNVERKIVTVEDPVEFAMDGVNQIQVNPAINLTFSNTLRHLLRHDPDVLLIGEIRDRETAEIAFQASLTGHMVLSTLHTNDVPSSFVRLVDMGVEPYLVNAAVEGVAAQRLLRRTCASCSNDPARRESCPACGGVGYKGRIAVMEFSGMTSAVKRAMLEGAEEHRIRAMLAQSGFTTMREEAERLAAAGVTDMAEVARVLGHVDPIDDDRAAQGSVA